MSPIRKKSNTRKKRAKNPSAKPRTSADTSVSPRSHGEVGKWFAKLVAVQKRLRAPQGCPWDREQTHESLRTYLIEEAYEVLDAMQARDDAKFADELGDLLLQVLFHADIAREDGRFDVVDVIRAIHDKMIRRHPHVFGDVSAQDSAEVLKNWDRIKAEERRAAAAAAGSPAPDAQKQLSLLDGVGRGLPATLEGLQLTRKAARIGFDWEDAGGVLEKIREECTEISVALAIAKSTTNAGGRQRVEEEVGDLLFAAVNLARFLKIDPEIALHQANGKFAGRFRVMERMAREGDRELAALARADMEKLWDAVKEREHQAATAPAGSQRRRHASGAPPTDSRGANS